MCMEQSIEKILRSRTMIVQLVLVALVISTGFLWYRTTGQRSAPSRVSLRESVVTTTSDLFRSNEEWRRILTPEQFHILREQGTEPPFSSPLDAETRPGTYVSADCGEPLFRSEQKYHSGTGWPSFWAPIRPDALTLIEDRGLPFEVRTEVRASKCGGHLGHVFDDGPAPTGKRYCMNGLALRFVPDDATSTASR